MSQNLLNIFQIFLAAVLIFLILLQSKAGGLGATFGGLLTFYRSKRGVEKLFHVLTIVFSFLFFLTAIISFILFS